MVLNLNWEIIWVFVNLLILFLLMKKFLFGPITKLLDERAKGVADTLDQAETQLAEAERQKAEYTQQLASARGEAAHIVEEARKRADLAYSRRMDEAAQDVQRLNEQAARQRAADREAAGLGKKQVADLVLLTTARCHSVRWTRTPTVPCWTPSWRRSVTSDEHTCIPLCSGAVPHGLPCGAPV
ncbi:MAG: F0F1 ATP synthase subunit B [Evtepia gabavorous]